MSLYIYVCVIVYSALYKKLNDVVILRFTEPPSYGQWSVCLQSSRPGVKDVFFMFPKSNSSSFTSKKYVKLTLKGNIYYYIGTSHIYICYNMYFYIGNSGIK